MRPLLVRDVPVTLGDVEPGSIVVVDLGGEHRYVVLGNLLGQRVSKSKVKSWQIALVHDVDPDTLDPSTRDCYALAPDTEVVDVVESYARRRMMASVYGRRRAIVDSTDDGADPVLAPKRDGAF